MQPIIETHPLAPFLPKKAKLLMLGSFPPPKNKWKMDFYYPNYQNDMWRIIGLLFFKDVSYFLDIANKNFYLDKIKAFLHEYHIAIFDTAYKVKRLKGNASDKFLEVIEPSSLTTFLTAIPDCKAIMTTGEKATQTLMQHFPTDTKAPTIQQSSHVHFINRDIKLYRMPSTSRAYPLALQEKAQAYQKLFKEIGLL
ncbi:hypothetical protein P256_00652 [Acinetobacter nectaris CIP 110549]|uniref:Uracil-DNA glycosylase-like domain-containing protein n=1 Tax=Acinetobacter nectaris CIP 110549 TaxID=1392540 RepID=V2TQ55_9GAMM|nr:uracil-DNA glycosylase family protein [Acinetobacter nectaris]ESK40211.1 hypothetical protein P256_00652 [Acinetobacter nectaris CIP 110549]